MAQQHPCSIARWLWLALALATFGLAAPLQRLQAQDNTSPPSRMYQAPQQSTGYTVTGRVICADTQRAARFAQVQLIPAQSSGGEYDRGRRANAHTDLDGRFVMTDVAVGDYFVTAQVPGYVNEGPAVQMALSAGGDALNAVAAVPRVQVTAGGGAVQVSLQRGAVVAGTVQWDDGTPAAGVQVSAQAAPADGVSTGTSTSQLGNGFGRGGLYNGFAGGGQTDDRGRFRLSGLAPGSYVVRASVQSPLPATVGDTSRFQHLMTLSVYAPNKIRRTEATVLTLTAGEERSDVAITLGLAGMHTVSGAVSSSSAAVHGGSVTLVDQTDTTLNRRANIGADGSFSVPYVPPGNYTVRVTASSQTPGSSSDSAVRFQPLQASVTVADSDLNGLNLTVNPASTAAAQ